MLDAPILLDVSRLIWRQWTRRLPTGIDRVCLAYLDHFRSRSCAVVQFRGIRRILDRAGSNQLFDLLSHGSGSFRRDLILGLARTAVQRSSAMPGQIYLNVGHTGLNSAHLRPWLADLQLRPLFFIHDLIPLTHPQYCRAGEAARHEQRMETALRAAAGLIVNSAVTQKDVIRFADERNLVMPPSLVAWLGIDRPPMPATAATKARRRPYFVMIGTIEARKNHRLILQVWADLIARMGSDAPDLILIGQRGWEAEEAFAILDNPGSLQGHVHEMGRCDDMMMGELLGGARALLMPSFAEGFGLPPIEALDRGIPVIASDLAALREIAGDVPTYLDPTDRSGWLDAIADHIAGGSEYRRQMAAVGSFEAPRWRDHFKAVEQFIAEL